MNIDINFGITEIQVLNININFGIKNIDKQDNQVVIYTKIKYILINLNLIIFEYFVFKAEFINLY